MSLTTALKPFTRHSARRARRSALVVPLVAALALAGCSSDSSTTDASDGGSGGGGGAASSEAVAAATTLLDEAASSAVTGPSSGALTADQIVPWTADMMPVPVALPEGEEITVDIVYGLAVGEGPYLANLITAIAEELGWKTKIIQADGQSQASSLAALQQAVNDKPTAIISLVIPGVWVGGVLADAKEQGIYTINVHQDSSTGPGYDAWVPASEGVQKSLLAAYAVKDSDGAASSLLVDAPGFSDVNVAAAKTYLDGCSDCKSESLQVNPLDLIDPVKLQSTVTAALAAHPGTGYLVWPTAALPVQPVLAAIRSSASKDTQLLLNGMAPPAVGLVKEGAVPLLVQFPDALLALAALDDVSRLVQGQPAIAEDALRLPVSYWTEDTVPDALDFAGITDAQLANDFLAPYESAWGVSLKDIILSIKK